MLKEVAFSLQGKTKYSRGAPIENAPRETDCLTSIHYILKCALGIFLPLTLVGDMPRELLALGEWKFHCIEPRQIRCGDLLFVKRIAEQKLIAHAALFLGPDEIFHCKRDVGAIVESLNCFHATFEQKLTYKQIIYIDPRNKSLREDADDIFLPKNKTIWLSKKMNYPLT